jgi:alkaline phosphatase D
VPLTPGDGAGGAPNPGPGAKDVFPQGVASGDPQPDSFIIWTRVEPKADDGDVPVEFVVATDQALTSVVVQGSFTAQAGADHTVKLRVTGAALTPATHYYYQFRARGVSSRVGRTKTAPAPDADTPVRFAFASCQDFIGRYYHAWQALLDETSEAGKDLDFIVFLGDYIYETDGDPSFQMTGDTRRVELPVGKPLGAFKAAVDVTDYRALYRAYRGDPMLQAVHERFPFVIIWDDHEFANDAAADRSSDKANVTGPADEEREPARRQTATRVWFEYQPVDVPAPLPDQTFDKFVMYRKLRFGKHVELFMTDERLYRDGPLVPEGPADLSVGKITENSSLGSHNFLLKSGFDVKEAAAKPTMLGEVQKKWFIEAVKRSQTTWKVWGNEVCLWQNTIDLSGFPTVPPPFNDLFYLSVDQWDGFRSERAEIFTALTGVSNLVAVTGDVHAFYASELHADFDAPTLGAPMAAEFVVAGISSQPSLGSIKSAIAGDSTLSSLGLGELADRYDELLRDANQRHLKYANSNVNGVAIVEASAGAFVVTFLQLGDITPKTYAGDVVRTTMRCQAGSSIITVDPLLALL